jgi:hypothetical protein
MITFLAGLVILAFSLFLQFQLAGFGLWFNLALAVLIAAAFIFDFWELVFLDLFAVFLLNWEPAPTLTLITFALIPIAAFLSKKVIRWESWIHAFVALAVGFLLFYLIIDAHFFTSHLITFVTDLIVGLLVGELVFLALS